MKNRIHIGLPLAATFPAMRRLAREVVRATQGVTNSAQTPVLCRDAGEPIVLAADQKWEVDVPTEFQWMPGGVHVITPTYGDRTIRLAVRCHEGTARAVQASFEQWRRAMPKQRPFGCVEHREQEAALLPTGFRWDGEKGGVNCACTPTALGAQNVNGRIHRSWSPSFTTDADYGACKCSDCGKGFGECDAVSCAGVMEFPEGARGSVQNPAEVTGVAFSVGSLTNKPAFRSIDPVRAKDGGGSGVVTATGTSEGAELGWQHRTSAAYKASAKANTHDSGEDRFKKEHMVKSLELHEAAAEAHNSAAYHTENANDISSIQSQIMSGRHSDLSGYHKKQARALRSMIEAGHVKSTDTTSPGTVRATWSDAAREAAAAARKMHTGQAGIRSIHYLLGADGKRSLKMMAVVPEGSVHEAANHLKEAGHEIHEIHEGGDNTHPAVTFTPKQSTDPTLRAHCKNNLYSDVPDATEAEAAAYDACVDGGGSHQQAVAELRKKRNPADATVQSSDAILAKLAQEQPPVRARTSDEILGAKPVKAAWSDAARQAAAEARKMHSHKAEMYGRMAKDGSHEDGVRKAIQLSQRAHQMSVEAFTAGTAGAHRAASNAHGAAADAQMEHNSELEADRHADYEVSHRHYADEARAHARAKRLVRVSDSSQMPANDPRGTSFHYPAKASDEVLSRLAAGRTGRTAA